MKIAERFFEDDGKIIHHRIHDDTQALERAKALHNSGAGQTGESRLVGTIPGHLIDQWMKEANVPMHDTEGRQEVMRMKILSGDFDNFRVWKGTF